MKGKEYVNLDNKPTFSKNMIILLLLIALLGAVGYIIYDKQNNKKDIGLETLTINDLERSREILKQELRLARADYDTAKTQIKIKDIDLEQKDREIFDKQKRIQNLLNQDEISKDDINLAKRLIVSLKTDLGKYKRQIEILLAENKTLQDKNNVLAEENLATSNLNKEISSTLDKVTTEKELENAKVNATLSISNYELTGLKVKNSGKEVETNRANRINKLRVAFYVDANKSAFSEAKELYVAIFKPDGSLGKFEGANAGQIPLRSGKIVDYSDRVRFEYDAKMGNKIVFDWKDYDFPKGEYKIDIYQNGFKIAQNKIELR